MGRAEEAEAELSEVVADLTQRAVTIIPSCCGTGPGTESCCTTSASSTLAKAELSAAVEALTRVLGADHPSTLRHRGHLADLLRDLGGTGDADHKA